MNTLGTFNRKPMMMMFHLVIILAIFFTVDSLTFPTLENVSSDYSVYHGEIAMFECDLKNTAGYPIVWVHHETGTYLYEEFIKSNARNDRYRLSYNSLNETFQLWIMDVQFGDAGTYACVWQGVCSVPMAWIRLTVIGTPTSADADDEDDEDSPSSSNNADVTKMPQSTEKYFNPVCEISYKTKDGYHNRNISEEIILICKSPAGMSHSTVEWYRNGEESIAGPFQTNAGYQRYLSEDDTDAIFTCVLRSPSLTDSRNCSVSPASLTNFGSASFSQSLSSSGNAALVSISTTFGILCLILIAAMAYMLLYKKKKIANQQITSVSAQFPTSPEGYMALAQGNQQRPPQYQPLKSQSNGRVYRMEPPPRRTRKARFKPAVEKRSDLNTTSNNTYAIPHISNLSTNQSNSRDDDSVHSYEVPA